MSKGLVIHADEAPHVPTSDTREQVKYMVACGLEVPHICYILKATPYEVQLYYKDELAFGPALVNASVAMEMLNAIKRGDMQSAQFWLRARGQWVMPTKVEAHVEVEHTHKVKRELMDEIINMMTTPKRKEAEAEVTQKSNAGSRRVN